MRIHDLRSDSGATAVEYSLLAVAIAAVIVAVVFVIGGYVQGQFQDTCSALDAEGVTNSGTSGGDCNS
jgi:pilus assembly protein Flp/PilA